LCFAFLSSIILVLDHTIYIMLISVFSRVWYGVLGLHCCNL
jgi:hypothetical protein